MPSAFRNRWPAQPSWPPPSWRAPSWRAPSSRAPSWLAPSWRAPSWPAPSWPVPSSPVPSSPGLLGRCLLGRRLLGGRLLGRDRPRRDDRHAGLRCPLGELLGESLESVLEFVESFGEPADLLGHLALHVGRNALRRLAPTIDDLLHHGLGIALLDVARVDQLFDERVGLFPGHFGEFHAGVDQLLNARNLHRRMLMRGNTPGGESPHRRRREFTSVGALTATPVLATPSTTVIRVGVTGHRHLADPEAVRRQCIAAVGRPAAQSRCGDRRDLVVARRGRGPDRRPPRAGPRRAVERRPAARRRGVPRDFATDRSVTEFDELLAAAQHVEVRDPTPTNRIDALRESAYERAGLAIVERCDVLLALWDGQPSRGRGGTAEIVEVAREHERLVIHIPVTRATP